MRLISMVIKALSQLADLLLAGANCSCTPRQNPAVTSRSDLLHLLIPTEMLIGRKFRLRGELND
jgi:hypothetical protein